MVNKGRFYIEYSSIFGPSLPYDEKFMDLAKDILKKFGCSNFRKGHNRGWANQPQVLMFSFKDDLFKVTSAELAIEIAIDRFPILIRRKDWKHLTK